MVVDTQCCMSMCVFWLIKFEMAVVSCNTKLVVSALSFLSCVAFKALVQ